MSEGERAADAGTFDRTGTRAPAAPRVVPKIDVTFDLDADGLLYVSVTDNGSGRSENVAVDGDKGGRLSRADIVRMLGDAERCQVGRERLRAENETAAKDRLESYVFGVQRALDGGAGGELTGPEKDACRQRCEAVVRWSDNNQLAGDGQFEQKLEEIRKSSAALMMRLHGGRAGEHRMPASAAAAAAAAHSLEPFVDDVD